MAGGTDNLIPFTKGGPNPHRQPGRGRPTPLNDPEWVDRFAYAVCEGLTTKQLMETFEVSDRTVRTYKNDPRVKNAATKHVNDRIMRITAKTDAKLDAILGGDDFKELPLEEQIALLLKVRKEYLGGAMRMTVEGGKIEAGQINDAMDELEDNPEFAAELRELLERGTSKG